MIRDLFIFLLVPTFAFGAETATTYGRCSPIAPNNNGTITINCQGISEKEADELGLIINKILREKLDLSTVIAKLDEILHEINPNSPKVTFTYDGVRRIDSPGRHIASNNKLDTYARMKQFAQKQDWYGLLWTCGYEMKQSPEWLTPFIYAGWSYLGLGQKSRAHQLLQLAEKRIAGNPNYDGIKELLSSLLAESAK